MDSFKIRLKTVSPARGIKTSPTSLSFALEPMIQSQIRTKLETTHEIITDSKTEPSIANMLLFSAIARSCITDVHISKKRKTNIKVRFFNSLSL